LPFDATLEDILILFQGLVVIDVVLIGQGEAFVIFANPMDYQMALQRDRQTIGRSFVAISPGSRLDYYSAIAIQQWQEQQGGPSSRSSDEIHMGDDQYHQRDVKGGSDIFGMSGMISSSYPSQSSGAIQGGNRGDIGPRHAGRGPMGGGPGGPMGGRGGNNTGRGNPVPPGGMVKRTGGGIQVGEHTGYLRMRGLPFSAAKEDVYVFFEEYHTVPDSIVLTYRSDGRATGEAYVQFETGDDSTNAMALHRQMMGNRYIELFLSNKEEHGRALTRFGDR